jgi:A/G-specific adenine glycosylase
VIKLCATRGESAAGPKPAPQKKRESHYALNCRDGEVLLVQRPRDASLMPGMWELPEGRMDDASQPQLTLRHSITVTDYTVYVWRAAAPSAGVGKWIPVERLKRVALTGLARKILLAAGIV